MARGGARKGAGRPKGSTNKTGGIRRAIAAQALRDGVSPLEVMVSLMRQAWEKKDLENAAKYAAMAAPYVHPRLAAVEMSQDDNRDASTLTEPELERIASASSAGAAETENSPQEPAVIH